MSVAYPEALIILLLIAANGFFSMAEIAIISSRKSRLQQRAEEGSPGAKAALKLANDPNSFLSAIQIGITLIGVLTGAFGGVTVAHRLEPSLSGLPYVGQYSPSIALGLVVATVTYLSLVIGELVPKRLALNNPERVAALVARPMSRLAAIATPVVALLGLSTDLVLRLLAIRASGEPPITEEEIKLLIEQGTSAGVFHRAEQEMMEGILRLGDRSAGTLMTPRKKVVWLDIKDSNEKIRRKIIRSPHSVFPVCQKRLGNVLGVVHVKDLLARMLGGHSLSLQDALQRPIFVHEGMHVFEVMNRFKETGNPMALVVDEYGTIEGLLTLNDVLQAVIGEITEGAEGQGKVIWREDGSCVIDGTVSTGEFKDLFDIKSLPEERSGQFETLGGFIMKHLHRIPSVGDEFECCGLRFEIVAMDGHRVGKVLVGIIKSKN